MKKASDFVGYLFLARDVAHSVHLNTRSFAKHMALGEYYAQIIELVDQFAEAYMGRYEQLKKFPDEFHLEKDPVKYLDNLKDFVEEARKELPQDSELQNLVDEIADLINSTLYKLRFLN